jgi:hypothetical protein
VNFVNSTPQLCHFSKAWKNEHLLFMTSGASPFTPTFPNYSLKNQTATKNTKTPHRKKKKKKMEKKWVDISPPAC